MRNPNRGCVLPCPLIEGLERRALFAADFVLEWNEIATRAVANDFTPSVVATPDEPGPTGTSRALAVVQAAVFDAVNSIDGSYRPYLVSYRGYEHASAGAAISQAAHDTLVAMYPHQRASFDAALRASLAKVPDGPAERRGADLGRRVAAAILQARQGDGAANASPYDAPVAPGVYVTFPGESAPAGVSWGGVTPFVLTSGSQFRADPPPPLGSPEYVAAYNEVKNYGGDGVTTPTVRTPEQTQTGIFWAYDGTPGIGTPPRFFNQIAQTIARQQHNTQVENARLFALVNLSLADAGITSWDTKYAYDFWRPIRGIRQLDAQGYSLDDGNPATDADANWTPLGSPYTNGPAGAANFTPPFPAYSSGHATFGAALFRTLANFYGTDDLTFTITSDELNGHNAGVDGVVRPLAPRTFTSFSQAAEENAQSRIYLGVHWSFDKTSGIRQGTQVADYVYDHVLTPVRSRPGREGHFQDRGGGHDGPMPALLARATDATAATKTTTTTRATAHSPFSDVLLAASAGGDPYAVLN
jgi:hypothetical protein